MIRKLFHIGSAPEHWECAVFVYLLFCFKEFTCFNVNTKYPRIYKQKDGSGFGFSVAQYSINGSTSVIVGAPLESNLAGGVYRCASAGCVPMSFDMSFDDGEMNAAQGFLGGAVTAATDGLVVACAPRSYFDQPAADRYEKHIIMMTGACFVYDGSTNTFLKPFTPCAPGTNGVSAASQGRCGAGFSVSSLEEKQSFVAGGVGSYAYSGQFIRMEKTSRRSPDYGPKGDDEYGYSGYAVTAGRFSGRSELDIVAGSPRSQDHTGEVKIYQRNLGINGGWSQIGETLQGNQFGSYFGSVLAAGDLNGDGLDDLVIAAPFYANTQDRIPDVGRVFIYYQIRRSDGHSQIFNTEPVILEGVGTENGRFGFSLAVLEDINQDGYNDLAVGQPLGGDMGKGSVHIFLGSNSGIKKQASQIIHGRDVDLGISSFGSALSGNLDMDSNQYPDLVVGSYVSSQTILLSTHPVVDITVKHEVDATEINLETYDVACRAHSPDAATCINSTTEVSYDGKSVPEFIYLDVTWSFDVDNTSDTIVFFAPEGKKVIKRSFPMLRGRAVISEHTMVFTRRIVEYVKPIGIVVSYDLTTPPDTVQSPILNAIAPRFVKTLVNIHRPPADIAIHVNGTTSTVVLANKQIIDLYVEIENHSPVPCYQVNLKVDFVKGITYSGIDSPNKVTCYLLEEEDSTAECNLGFLFPASSKTIFTLQMSIERQEFLFNSSSLPFVFNLTSVNDENPENDFATIELPLVTVSEIEIDGTSVPDQIQITTNSENVTHVFQLTNTGQSALKSTEIWIRTPVVTSSGIPLLTSLIGPLTHDDKASCHKEEHNLAPMGISALEPCDPEEHLILCRILHCETGMVKKGDTIVINVTGTVLPNITALSDQDNTVTLTARVRALAKPLMASTDDTNKLADYTEVVTLVAFPGVKRQGEAVATWIIVVSVVGGVILLVVIMVIFWKVGFFKRKIRDDLYSAKRISSNQNWDTDGVLDREGSAGDQPDDDDDDDDDEPKKNLNAGNGRNHNM